MKIDVVRVREADLGRLDALFCAIERESWPDDPGADARASDGIARARGCFDFLAPDSFWLFAAEVGGSFVGYATAARIPKLDARAGYLYLDELAVLQAYRRRGAASALTAAVQTAAVEAGYAGVRLLVRSENTGARALYAGLGFIEYPENLLCELPATR